MKTFITKPSDISRKWYLVDANGKTLGRLATEIAKILRGKHKPYYSTHLDTGDHVIVINSKKIKVTGKKAEQKIYYRHSGYPGGLKKTKFWELQNKFPNRIIEFAVKGMLPHNKLGRAMFKKLNVFQGPEHTHHPQKPEILDIG